jgi:hypothetical protein
MVYKKYPFITIHWDEEINAVVMEWTKFAVSALFRRALNDGLDLLIEKGSHRWLADLRGLGPVGPEDQKWSNEDWFPRAIAGGVTRMALVAPNSTLSKMSVDTIMERVGEVNLARHYFDSVEDARLWLAEG